jgi:hypothetical protein
MMKKFLLLVLILGAGGFLYLKNLGEAMDKESKAYVDDAIVKIVSSWSKEELRSRASPEFLKTAQPQDLEKLFAVFSKLGKMKEYKGSHGNANINFTTKQGKVIIAQYLAEIEFEKDSAKALLLIEKKNDRWVIHRFEINSKFFTQEMLKN